MIRAAAFTDIPAMVAVCHEAHATSRFADIPFSEGKCQAALYNRIADGGATWAVLVAEGEHMLDGMLVGYAMPAYEVLQLTVLGFTMFYTTAGAPAWTGKRLLDAFEMWGDSGGENIKVYAVENAVVDPERTGKLLQRRGFERSGTVWMKGAE